MPDASSPARRTSPTVGSLLAHTRLGAEAPMETLLLAHGILGSRRNWRSFGQRLVAARPGLRVILVDLRGHGDSHNLPGAATVEACADDLVALHQHLLAQGDGVTVLVGHSFGGKVCAAAAARWPTPLRQLWVLDAPLGARPGEAASPVEVERVIAALRSIPMPTDSRQNVADSLRLQGFSGSLCAWMTTNVRRTAAGFVWRFDLDVVEALLADYFERDLWPSFMEPRPGSRHLLVRGERSERWTAADIHRLDALERAGRARHLVLAEAGHWLHADNPTGLLALLNRELG